MAGAAAPGVVVARVQADRVLVAGQPLLEVLVGGVLVARQRVGVREAGLHLQRALEEAQRVLVLLRGRTRAGVCCRTDGRTSGRAAARHVYKQHAGVSGS